MRTWGSPRPRSSTRGRCSSWPIPSTIRRPSPQHWAPWERGTSRSAPIGAASSSSRARPGFPRARPSLSAGPRAEQPGRVPERPRPGRRAPTRPGVRRGRASSRAGGLAPRTPWSTTRSASGALDHTSSSPKIIPSGLKAAQPGMAFTWWALDVWLADAAGTSPPPPLDEPDTDAQSDLAWRTSGDLSRALTAGDPAEVARLAPVVLSHTMAAAGIDDDFFVLWPPLVLAALSIGDLDLAERLMAPVDIAPPAYALPLSPPNGTDGAVCSPRPATATLEVGRGSNEGRGRRPRLARAPWGFHAQAQEELGLAGSPPRTAPTRLGPCWRLPVRRTSRSAPPAGSPGSTRIRPPRSNRRLPPAMPRRVSAR